MNKISHEIWTCVVPDEMMDIPPSTFFPSGIQEIMRLRTMHFNSFKNQWIGSFKKLEDRKAGWPPGTEMYAWVELQERYI